MGSVPLLRGSISGLSLTQSQVTQAHAHAYMLSNMHMHRRIYFPTCACTCVYTYMRMHMRIYILFNPNRGHKFTTSGSRCWTRASTRRGEKKSNQGCLGEQRAYVRVFVHQPRLNPSFRPEVASAKSAPYSLQGTFAPMRNGCPVPSSGRNLLAILQQAMPQNCNASYDPS